MARFPRRTIILALCLATSVCAMVCGVSTVVAVTQIALALPLLLFGCQYAYRLRSVTGGVWVLLLAPLVRQFAWVTVPSVLYVTTKQQSFGLTAGPSIDDVSAATCVMTLSNCVIYVTIAALLRTGRSLILGGRVSSRQAFVGIIMLAVWIAFRLSEQYYIVVQGDPDRFGGSVTYIWGYIGLALILMWTMASDTTGSMSKRRMVLSCVLMSLVAGAMIIVGQRMYVIYPFWLGVCLRFSIAKRLTKQETVVSVACIVAVTAIAFIAVDGIRHQYYYSGVLPPLAELPLLLKSGWNSLADVAQEMLRRLTTMLWVGQLAIDDPRFFPAYNTAAVIATYFDSLVSGRIVSLSSLLGMTGQIEGIGAGAWLASALGRSDSTMTFQPEVAFYLAGGVPGVVIGSAATGVIVYYSVRLIRWVFQGKPSVGLALVVGGPTMQLSLAELYSTLAASLGWQLLVVIALLAACCGSERRPKTAVNSCGPELGRTGAAK